MPPKLVGWVQYVVATYHRQEKWYLWPVQPHAWCWWMQGRP